MNQKKISTIGRAVDPAYPTNQAILILTLLGTAAGTGFQLGAGMSLRAAAGWGLGAGLSVFLAWALTRELDPDHEYAAFASAVLAFGAVFFWGLPDLGVIFWSLLLIRVVNHTTGLSATGLDTLGVIGISSWLSYRGNPGIGVVATLALLGDAVLPGGKKRQSYLAGMNALIVLLTLFLGVGRGVGVEFSWAAMGISLAGAALFGWVVGDSSSIKSTGDQTGEVLLPARVQGGQLLALVIVLEMTGWLGWQGMLAVLPLWAAVGGILAARVYLSLRAAR
ncbi:MAG: hypothetical protein U5K99_00660 [Anaerolineales bacterium]|nr:hypothetical protein [Anaerolineales bacterium]